MTALEPIAEVEVNYYLFPHFKGVSKYHIGDTRLQSANVGFTNKAVISIEDNLVTSV
jgi:hypothetical protein